ncbi:MAG TPA: tyrosine-type recombinase/integrase [Gemmatimonadaceae bacterium]|jgi:integrase
MAILRAVIGDHREVRTLTENDVRQYEARRTAGGITYGDGQRTESVRQRSVQADIKLLKQMLSRACTRTTAQGTRWLEQNPLQYVRIRGEHDVKRPVASYERYEATRQQMVLFQRKYELEMQTAKGAKERRRAESRHLSWVRAELGLSLLAATGRRRGAIMGLRWSDFDAASGCVTWRAEHDKKGKTWVVPYPTTFFATIRDFQKRLGAVGGFVFPRQGEPNESAPPELLSQWIRKAEVDAELTKLQGGTCHPYRRKWRSERPHHALKAVMQAGGWSDVNTMLRCYDHPEASDVLAVTAEPRKRKESTSG